MFVEHWQQALVLTVLRGGEGRVLDVAILSSSGMAPPVLDREGFSCGWKSQGSGAAGLAERAPAVGDEPG